MVNKKCIHIYIYIYVAESIYSIWYIYIYMVDTWTLKWFPSHHFGAYAHTIQLHGALGKVATKGCVGINSGPWGPDPPQSANSKSKSTQSHPLRVQSTQIGSICGFFLGNRFLWLGVYTSCLGTWTLPQCSNCCRRRKNNTKLARNELSSQERETSLTCLKRLQKVVCFGSCHSG